MTATKNPGKRENSSVHAPGTVGYLAAAKHLGISVRALQWRVQRGTVPHYRVSDWVVRFKLDELDEWRAGTKQEARTRRVRATTRSDHDGR